MKTFKRISLAALLPLFFAACASTVYVREDMSPAEIIQRAQEAIDHGRFNTALQLYTTLLERNPHNIDLVITAYYEIAFIRYRQRRFGEAREGMLAVLEFYNTPDAELLPQHFRRLAEIVLARIDERERQGRRFRRS